jgi:hypothetical protein
MALDMSKLKNQKEDYQDEFMKHLPEFSESWREQALKEQRF